MAQERGAAPRLTADVADFLSHLSAERGLSANTVSAYAADAQQFVEHLLDTGRRDWAITRADVDRYCEMLAGRGYAMSTQSRKIASVRALYRFLQERGRVAENPTDDLHRSWRRQSPPSVLATEEIDRLIETATASPGEFAGQRERAMFEVLYGTGVHASELVRLDVSDVDLRASQICCGRGTRAQRDQPVGPRVGQALRSWMFGQRRQVAGEGQTALFVNRRGERLTRQGFWLIFKRVVQNAGLDRRVSPRTIRHTFATNLAARAASASDVREGLGHSSASASTMYRRLAREDPKSGDRLHGS